MLLLGQESLGHWQTDAASQPDVCVHVVAPVESQSKQPFFRPPLTTTSRLAHEPFYFI